MASSSNSGFASGSGSGSNPDDFDNRDKVWDFAYGCWKVGGVLFPEPISSAPPQQAPEQQQQQLPEQNDQYGRRRRNLTSSRVVEVRVYTFKLFDCAQLEKHVLERTEVDTDNIKYYLLTPCERAGKRKMDAKETNLEGKAISPKTGEIYTDLENKTSLTIQQRLEGRWFIEDRERLGSTKVEKFYIHEKVDRTFRSMNDVATFIAYNATY